MKRIIMFCLVLATVFFACSKFDDFEGLESPESDAEFAIPIANADFSVSDLLENLDEGTNLFVDPNGTLRLNYKGRLAVKTSLDVFESVQKTLQRVDSFPVFDTLMALPFGSPDSVDIDYMALKKGQLHYRVISDQLDIISLEIIFPNATKDGVPLRKNHILLPFTEVKDVIDLSGHLLVPENDSIYLRYVAKKSNGQRISLQPFLFWMSLRDIEFSYTEGYFGQIVHEGDPDTIKIDFFDNWTRGDVYFEDPTITIYTKNSFGIPTRSIIHYFDVKTVNSDVLELQSPYITNGVNFAYPRLPDEVGQTKIDTFTFNRHNSNIDQILGAGPELVYYDVDALTNPERDPNLRGFITDSSAYEVQVEVDLPLYGKSSGFAVRDTFDWDFSGYSEVKKAEFKIVSENGVGLEIGVQGYFMDDKGQVLDSLFEASKAIVEAADVDGNGNVIRSKKAVNYAPFTAERFANIRNAKRILIHAAFFTTDKGQTSVRVKKEQKMNLRMGMKIGL